MKTKITLLALVLSTFTFGQTNIISLKSHSGDLKDIALENDNFGEMSMPRIFIDSVIYLKPGVMIESKHSIDYYIEGEMPNRFHDTIKDPSITNILTFSLKRRYGGNVVFVGFTELKTNNVDPHFQGMKRNGFSMLVILLEILLVLGLLKTSKLGRE